MQAIEFTTQLQNGVIQLPQEFQSLAEQTMRVIILLDDKQKHSAPLVRFPDLSAFRERQPIAKTSSKQLIRQLRDEES